MKGKTIFICGVLILLLNFGSFAQKRQSTKQKQTGKIVWNYEYYKPSPAIKISTATETLPKDFTQHDIVKLFENLRRATANFSGSQKTDAQMSSLLKNKKILGDLTADNLFAFQISSSGSRYGTDAKNRNLTYQGKLYPLNDGAFIEPLADTDGGCGVGTGAGYPTVDSRDDLITRAAPKNSLDEFWRNNYFQVDSFMPIYNRKLYKGKLDKNEEHPDCSFIYFVPSPQAFYQLVFNRRQPYQLVEVEDYVFDLEEYDYHRKNKIGVVAWQSDVQTRVQEINEIFVVKLVPPFVSSKTIEKYDAVEKRNFRAIVNQLVVDIVGIWAIDAETGNVLSKEIGQKSNE